MVNSEALASDKQAAIVAWCFPSSERLFEGEMVHKSTHETPTRVQARCTYKQCRYSEGDKAHIKAGRCGVISRELSVRGVLRVIRPRADFHHQATTTGSPLSPHRRRAVFNAAIKSSSEASDKG